MRILLAAGGYAPQLSTQALLGLVALWLLDKCLESQPRAAGLQPADRLPVSAAP